MRTIPCDIETLKSEKEEIWMIAVSASAAEIAAVLFAALHLGRSDKVIFLDKKTGQRLVVRTGSLTFGNGTISITHQWMEVIWTMFVDVDLFGWSDTFHVDQDFADKNGDITITIQIIPKS